jgi:hypothetical protein
LAVESGKVASLAANAAEIAIERLRMTSPSGTRRAKTSERVRSAGRKFTPSCGSELAVTEVTGSLIGDQRTFRCIGKAYRNRVPCLPVRRVCRGDLG